MATLIAGGFEVAYRIIWLWLQGRGSLVGCQRTHEVPSLASRPFKARRWGQSLARLRAGPWRAPLWAGWQVLTHLAPVCLPCCLAHWQTQ